MNRKLLFWLTLILLSMSSLPLFSQFAGGSGTEQDPWQVATAEHLNNVRNYLGDAHANKHFIQTADIDLDVAPWNQGQGWMAIGRQQNIFYGKYNGNSHIISGLTGSQGLFGYSHGTIKNLGVINVNLSGASRAGAVVGTNRGIVSNCHSSGQVSGSQATGGLAGYNNGTISRCYSSGNVTGNQWYTGGLVGHNFRDGYIQGPATIINCFSSATVTGGSYGSGGLVGLSKSGIISNCYSTGYVSGSSGVGGLLGVKENDPTITSSYWDIITSGKTNSAGGVGRQTSEMVYPHSENTYQGWDSRNWRLDPDHSINDGYPFLRYPDIAPTQRPSPAFCVYPENQADHIHPKISLLWNIETFPDLFALPLGFKLWLGTDNPPSNICNGIDLGFDWEYRPAENFELNTDYFWKIVPYNAKGDALDCPVWSFSTYHPDYVLLYPNGGEVWQSGTTRTIQWIEALDPWIHLSISFDGGNEWNSIGTVTDKRNYFHYQVPSVNSNACLIKLNSSALLDISDGNFSISTSISRPKVVLTYPSEENDHLGVGKIVNLTWTRQNVATVSLDYSVDDGQTWTEIASGLDSDSYSWLVPDTPSSQCRVRVRSDLDPEVLDISDNAVSICKIQITSPIGGEVFISDYSNSYYTHITWTTSAIDNLKIEYSSDGGTSWSNIVDSTSSSPEEYHWTLPGVPSSDYLIRISNAADNSINSVSEPFTLRNPIKLINVNGGGFITNNSMFNIRWKMQDIDPIDQIFLEYSYNDDYWNRINSNAVTVSDESMHWFVNISLNDSVWLRAVREGSNRILTKSEAPFRVTDKMLSIIEPNGGEEYREYDNQTISWDCDGLTNLNILFSSDDGETWTQIAENVPASSGSYAWAIPAMPSYNCRIRLQDQTHAYMRLDSDLPFSILPLQVIDPTVDFTADVLSGDIPLSVQFSSEIDPGVGSIASLLWDFGDGNTSTEANPVHVYEVPGTYTVSLSVTNSFGGTATESKEDYITALPQTPRIELLSLASLNFGVVYLGDTSPAQSIEVKNVGTAALHIDSASFHLPNSQFALTDTELPITVPVDDSALLKVVFIPVVSGAVGDSIFIHSDASNEPSLALRLSAVGEYVPPAAVEGLAVSIEGNDAQLTWEPVTKTIYDTPIEPDGYIVLYNETPYEDEHFYYFFAYVPETNHVHSNVALFREHMFYRIVAVKFYRGEEVAWLRGLNSERDRKLTWGELKEELGKVKRRP